MCSRFHTGATNVNVNFGFFIKQDPGFVYNRKNSLLFCKVHRRGKLISARLSTLFEPSEQTSEALLLEARASLFVCFVYFSPLHNIRICKAWAINLIN